MSKLSNCNRHIVLLQTPLAMVIHGHTYDDFSKWVNKIEEKQSTYEVQIDIHNNGKAHIFFIYEDHKVNSYYIYQLVNKHFSLREK